MSGDAISVIYAFIAGGMFVVLFVVEKLFPLRESKAGLLARVVVNGLRNSVNTGASTTEAF